MHPLIFPEGLFGVLDSRERGAIKKREAPITLLHCGARARVSGRPVPGAVATAAPGGVCWGIPGILPSDHILRGPGTPACVDVLAVLLGAHFPARDIGKCLL